jgi:hypothetical protein
MTYGNYGPTTGLRFAITDKQQPGRPLTPSELSARWPSSVPENCPLTEDRWIGRDAAAKALAKANGSDLLETGHCYLNALMQAGRLDVRGSDVRLIPESERAGTPRPGSPEAAADEARLSRLRSDLAALRLKAVPVEKPAV